MAQFRTTADLVDAVLDRAGEPTNGTSQWEASALLYLNKIHMSLISGGLIFDPKKVVNIAWKWAQARHPYTLELLPKHNTGTLTVTQDSTSITFSSAPASSLEGWHIRKVGSRVVYKIVQHTAAVAGASIDSAWVEDSGSGVSFEAFKLDYDVVPSHLYIESSINDKIDFVKSGTTEVTATLTPGAYTPSALATHVAAAITTAAIGGASTYSGSFSAITGKFTLTSSLSGGEVFYFKGLTGTNVSRSALGSLGFDLADTTSAASQISTYKLGGLARLAAPAQLYGANTERRYIPLMESRRFNEDFPLGKVNEGSPLAFHIVRESADGIITIRISKFPSQRMKLELPVVPLPLDLKDSSASIPLVPRKYADMLEFGAAYFLGLDKKDDQAQAWLQLAQAQLDLMSSEHHAQNTLSDPHFGELVARPEALSQRRLRYGYDAGLE